MNTKNTASLATLRHLRGFVVLHGVAMCPVMQSRAWRSLCDVIKRVDHRLEQKAAAVGYRSTADLDIHVLRWRLSVGGIRPALRLARTVLSGSPELAALPSPRPDASVAELIHAGYSIAYVITRHYLAFVNAGLSPNAAENLRTLADRLESVVKHREAIDKYQVDSTIAIEAHLKRGRAAARELDALIATELASSPCLVAVWKRERSSRPRRRHGFRFPLCPRQDDTPVT